MADTKLSALTELAAAPASDDEVYIRDVSEAAADESKRITITNLQKLVANLDLNGFNISFPATQAPDAGANVLDDYEEFDWTPGYSDSSLDAEGDDKSQTYFTQVGKGTKIGREIHLSFSAEINSLGSMTAGDPTALVGIPTASNSTASLNHGGIPGTASSLALNNASENVTFVMIENVSYINPKVWDGTAGVSALLISELSAGGNLRGGLSYLV